MGDPTANSFPAMSGRLPSSSSPLPRPAARTSSISSAAPGTSACRASPCTTSSKSSASTNSPATTRLPSPPWWRNPPRYRCPPCRRSSPCRNSPPAGPSPRRCPPFRRTHPVRRCLLLPATGVELAHFCPGVFPRRLRHAAPGPVDQRLQLDRRYRADVSSRGDGGCGLCVAVRRSPVSLAVHRWRLAAALAVVRGRCLLPKNEPLAPAPRSGRAGQLRRAHHPALDAQIQDRQGLRHHPQQVHALREVVLHLRT